MTDELKWVFRLLLVWFVVLLVIVIVGCRPVLAPDPAALVACSDVEAFGLPRCTSLTIAGQGGR